MTTLVQQPAALKRTRVRPPTGRVPWPLILVEGGEKAGKSWAVAVLSACDKVGRTYWIDLTEGSADEYGAIPGTRYVIVDHDGSWQQIFTAVKEIREEARRAADAGEPPVVLAIDSMTAEWDLLKNWTYARARKRMERKGRRVNEDDPVKADQDLWNDANDRHRQLMTLLMTFPGIVVMTARGKEISATDDNGRPIPGAKDYRVEGQKNLGFDASVWVRMSRGSAPLIIGARSVHAGVQPEKDEPRKEPGLTLERLIFDILKCDPSSAHVRDLPVAEEKGYAPGQSPEELVEAAREIRDRILSADLSREELLAEYKQADTTPGLLGVVITDDTGEEVPLGDLIKARGQEAKAREQKPEAVA